MIDLKHINENIKLARERLKIMTEHMKLHSEYTRKKLKILDAKYISLSDKLDRNYNILKRILDK